MPKVQRWYIGFYYRGNPQDLINQIAEQVKRQNLSKLIPLLRVEKGAKPRKVSQTIRHRRPILI